MRPFSATTHITPGGSRVEVHGECDLATVPAIEAAIERHQGQARLHLDLSKVTFLDSTAVSLLLTTMRRAEAEGFRLRVTLPQEEAVLRPLAVCGVLELLAA